MDRSDVNEGREHRREGEETVTEKCYILSDSMFRNLPSLVMSECHHEDHGSCSGYGTIILTV